MKDDKKHFFFQPLVELTSSTENTQQRLFVLIFVKPCKAFLKLANIYYFYFYLTNFVDRRLIDRNPSYMVKHKISGPMLLHMDCGLMDYARDVLSLIISS